MSDLKREIGERLKEARERKNLKQNRVALHLGVHNSTLAKYESGHREPDNETLNRLAELYEVSTDWILTGENRTAGKGPGLVIGPSQSGKSAALTEMLARSNGLITKYVQDFRSSDRVDLIEDRPEFVPVPIYGEIKAGYNQLAQQQVIGYEIVSKRDIEDGEYFYLIVKGDSMIEEGIREGCKVLVRKQSFVDEGKIGVVLVNGEEATLKRVFYDFDTVILQASNKNIPPRVVPQSEVIIQGQVKHFVVDV